MILREVLEPVLDTLPQPVIGVDRAGRIAYANPALRRLGRDPRTIIGRPAEELVSPEDKPAVATRSLFRKEPVPINGISLNVAMPGGQSRPVAMRLYGMVLQSEAGQLVETHPTSQATAFAALLYFALEDRTALHQAIQVIEQYQNTTHALLAATPDCAVLLDRDGFLLYMNDSAAREARALSGLDREELLGRNLLDLRLPEMLVPGRERLREVVDAAIPLRFLDGSLAGRTFHVTVVPFRGEKGEVNRLATYAYELTNLKEALREFWIPKEKYEALFHGAGDAILIVDPEDGLVLDANQAAQRLLGRERDAIVGRPVRAIHPPAVAERYQALYREKAEAGARESFDAEVHPQEGGIVPVTVLSTFVDLGGERVLMAVVRDMSQARRVENLRLEKEAADSAIRAKNEFLSNLSHELRTPLNAMLGSAELLEGAGLKAEERAHLQVLQRAGGFLRQLVDDLLDITRIESGSLRVEIVPFDLRVLVSEVAELFRREAEAKGLSLQTRLAPDLPARLAGDGLRIRQLLCEIVGNAVKFTKRGGVQVEVSGGPSGDRFLCRFTVRDTGQGIADADQQRIFEPFTQADKDRRANYAGVGLGLALVQRLVKLLGGTIRVQSESGRGAAFHVELPATVVTGPAAPEPSVPPPAPAPGPAGAKGRVLVVDDDDDNRLILQHHLRGVAAEVVTAGSGTEALARMAEGAFDLVLMDCRMPVMDGYELAGRIRKLPPPACATRLVGVTANALQGDREKCLKAGMDDYMPKPFSRQSIADMVVRHVGGGKP